MPLLIDTQNCSIYQSRLILDNVTVQIEAFQHTAILGPNGSGKSTLIRMLTKELYPSRMDGENPVNLFMGREDWSQAELRQMISVVSMKFADALLNCVGLTVYESLASAYFGTYGYFEKSKITAEMQGEIDDVMASLNLNIFADRLITELSTGELRKVLIARAMLIKPTLIILDEPSLGLDIAAQSDFFEYVKQVAKSVTVIIVTHHLEEVIPDIKNVLLMKEGRIFSFGAKEDILTQENLSALFETPIGINLSKEGIYSMYRI